MAKQAFGIDIGGSGIKGAPVNLKAGELAADRMRIPTPQPSTPEAVASTVKELIDSFDVDDDMPVGVTFPAIIHNTALPSLQRTSISRGSAQTLTSCLVTSPGAMSSW